MILRESMGIGADSSDKAFNSRDIEAFLKRPRLKVPVDLMGGAMGRGNTRHVLIAVDPSGGGGSAFAIASACQLPNGTINVRRSFARPPARPVANRLARPHLGQHVGKHDKRVGALARVAEEERREEGDHAVAEVGCVGPVGKLLRNLGLLAHGVQKERAPARDAVGVGRQPLYALQLVHRVPHGHVVLVAALVVDLRNERDDLVVDRVQLGRRVPSLSARERRPHHELAHRHVLCRAQILGVDMLRARDVKQTHALIVQHIASTRQIYGLENSTAVLQLESNLGFESQHILHHVTQSNTKRWLAMSEGVGGTLGWLCTHERKEARGHYQIWPKEWRDTPPCRV